MCSRTTKAKSKKGSKSYLQQGAQGILRVLLNVSSKAVAMRGIQRHDTPTEQVTDGTKFLGQSSDRGCDSWWIQGQLPQCRNLVCWTVELKSCFP